MRILKLAVVAAIAPILLGANSPTTLQPTGNWTVDYANDSCRLSREFGAGGEAGTLVLERVSPDASPTMLFMSKLVDAPMGGYEFIANSVPSGMLRATYGQAGYTNGDHTPIVMWSNVGFGTKFPTDEDKAPPFLREQVRAIARGKTPPPFSLEAQEWLRANAENGAEKVTAIQIGRPGRTPVVLNSGSFGPAMAMLRQCASGQLRGWGIDPQIEEKITKRVQAIKPLSWFNSNDYPLKSLREWQESQLQVRALVDAQGNITKCTPITRVANPEFPEKVCQVMTRRARFHPAELDDGTKVPSYYIQTIRFSVAGY